MNVAKLRPIRIGMVGRLSLLEMGSTQARHRQQVPPASLYRAFRYVGLASIHLCKFDLRAGQALFGSGQQPPDGLRSVAFDNVTAIVPSVFINDSEIELHLGIASFGGFKQMFFHTSRRSSTSGIRGRAPPPWKEQHISCFLRRGDALSAASTRLED
jgi:hypothetical protein